MSSASHPEPVASTSALPSSASAIQSSFATVFKRKGKAPATGARADPWWKVTYELENKGSVARDHLASERTYLAWLRTSLSLASIGIAITQLFRLDSGSTSGSNSDTNSTVSALSSYVALSDPPDLADLHALLAIYAARLDAVAASGGSAGDGKYRHLGKPIGGTFVALALVFLVLGSHRYFQVQKALVSKPSQFPPARRSVVFASFCVAAIVAAAFGVILATK